MRMWRAHLWLSRVTVNIAILFLKLKFGSHFVWLVFFSCPNVHKNIFGWDIETINYIIHPFAVSKSRSQNFWCGIFSGLCDPLYLNCYLDEFCFFWVCENSQRRGGRRSPSGRANCVYVAKVTTFTPPPQVGKLPSLRTVGQGGVWTARRPSAETERGWRTKLDLPRMQCSVGRALRVIYTWRFLLSERRRQLCEQDTFHELDCTAQMYSSIFRLVWQPCFCLQGEFSRLFIYALHCVAVLRRLEWLS